MYHERVRNVNVGEETDLVGRVVAALRESTGLASRVVSWGPGVDVEIANLSLRVVTKRRIDRATAVAVISSRIVEEGRADSGHAGFGCDRIPVASGASGVSIARRQRR
jgi:hypothetical protein